MSEYRSEDYFPILTSSIREGRSVPFDCYILLRANQRVIRFIQSGDVVDDARIKRLKNFQFNELYILHPDRPAYEEYLRAFFGTEEGRAVIQEVNAQRAAGEVVQGIPDEIAEQFGVQVAAEATDTTSTNEVMPESEPEKQENQVVRLLREQAEQLDESLKSKNEISQEDRAVIVAVTQKIEEELIRVKALDQDDPEADAQVATASAKIKEELQRISGIAKKEGRAYRTVQAQVEQIEKEVKKIEEAPRKILKKKKPGSDIIRVSGSGLPIDEGLKHLRNIASSDPSGTVAQTVDQMISGLETLLGAKLEIRKVGEAKDSLREEVIEEVRSKVREEFKKEQAAQAPEELKKQVEEEIREKVQEETKREIRKALDEGRDPFADTLPQSPENKVPEDSSVSPDTSDDGAAPVDWRAAAKEASADLATKVEDQAKLIQTLHQKLTTTQNQYYELQTKWNELQVVAGKSYTDQAKLAAKSFSVQMRDLETSYVGMKAETDLLVDASVDLCEAVGVDPVAASDPPPPSDDAVVSKAEAKSDLDMEAPPDAASEATYEEIQAENGVLRSQLEDAKALIQSNHEKVKELQSIINDSSPYIQGLEKESDENRKTIEKLQEKIAGLESGNLGLSETANSAQKIATKAKNELQNQLKMIEQYKDQVGHLEEELKVFRDKFKNIPAADIANTPINEEELPPDVLGLLKSKDQLLNKQQTELDQRMKQIRELERANSQLKGTMDDSATLKKRMGQKFERMEAEKEQARREYEAMNRRMAAASNLADQERKTLLRMTAMMEELKKERVEFMSKTNASMKGYKDMMSKANSLNNSVQAEMGRNKKLQEQMNVFKNKNRTLMADLAEAERYIKKLESDMKALKKGRASKSAA